MIEWIDNLRSLTSNPCDSVDISDVFYIAYIGCRLIWNLKFLWSTGENHRNWQLHHMPVLESNPDSGERQLAVSANAFDNVVIRAGLAVY